MFGPIRIHSEPLGCVRTHSEAFGSIWTFSKNFKIFWIASLFNVFGRVQTHSDRFGPTGMHSEAFRSIWKHLDVLKKIEIFWILNGFSMCLIGWVGSVIFRSFENFSKDRLRRDDRFHQKIVKIQAILAIFRLFKDCRQWKGSLGLR